MRLPKDWIRLEEISWSAGKKGSVDLSQLENLGPEWDIDAISIMVEPDIENSSAAAQGEDCARIISDLKVSDGNERLDAFGPLLRVINQHQLGQAFVDPADASGSGNDITETFFLHVPFGIYHGRGVLDPRDTRVPAPVMAERGRISYVLSDASLTSGGTTVSSATITFWARIRRRNGRRPEAPVRVVYTYHDVSKQSDNYDVQGKLLAAFLTAPQEEGDSSGNNDFSSVSTIISKTFGYGEGMEKEMLLDQYRRAQRLARGDSEDVFEADEAVLVWEAEPGMKLADCPFVRKLHVKLDASPPTNCKLVLIVVSERTPEYGAAATGMSPGEYSQRLQREGIVATRDGRVVPVNQPSIGRKLAKFLPVKFRGGAQA